MRALLGVLLSFALGLGSAYLGVRTGLTAGDVRVGPWRTNLATGTAAAGLYTRARVAVAGLLALAPTETIYFTASSDDAGEPLRASCDYRLEGGELPARWWSITAYGADHFLIPNAAGRYSIGQTTVLRDASGRWTAYVSSEPRGGNWIPSGEPGEISLTARLYNPDASVAQNPASAELPSVTREACR